MKDKLYRKLAIAIDARTRCDDNRYSECEQIWCSRIEKVAKDKLPSGSGFDNGTTVDLDRSTGELLVLDTSFHHMNENGYYDGWTEHTVRVRPSLIHGTTMTVSGQNRNDIKDYIVECLDSILNEQYEWDPE